MWQKNFGARACTDHMGCKKSLISVIETGKTANMKSLYRATIVIVVTNVNVSDNLEPNQKTSKGLTERFKRFR